MEFQSVINKRKMIRSFKQKPIPDEKLTRIIKNMFKGPSAGFSQGIEILVLKSEESRIKFYEMWGTEIQRKEKMKRWSNLENAPVIILVFSHKNTYLNRYAEHDKGWIDKDETRWPVPFWYIDAGMAALLGLLTVVDENLAALFTGAQDREYIQQNFKVPEEYTPIGAISIGYPEENDPQSPSLSRGRRSLDEVVHQETW